MTTETVCTLVPSVNQEISASTNTFSCDVDGTPFELVIPEDAWDVKNETVWLTQAQLAELYGSSVQNVGYHIGNILEDEELQECSVLKESFITAANGNSYRTKLYNIDMLLSLGYRIKSKVAIKFRQWATKHLKELMTKGRTEIQPHFALPKTLPEALRAYAAEIEAKEKALQERDEAIRTKAMIGSKREATAMATAAAKSRECKKLTAENEELTAENEELKDAIGRGSNWRTVSMMKSEWIRDFGHAPVWQKLKNTFSKDLEDDEKPIKDVEEKVILPNGSERVSLAYRYHMKAWAKYREYEENLRATDIEIATA